MYHMSWSQEIKGLREELASRLNSSETLELIKEKEEQIRELLEEGECSRLFYVFNEKTFYFVILEGSGYLLRVWLFTCFFLNRWETVQAAVAALQHHKETACEREREWWPDHQTDQKTEGTGRRTKTLAAGQGHNLQSKAVLFIKEACLQL